MAKDLIYYSDLLEITVGGVNSKLHTINELGEVQQNFNMSLTLDGTKDSVHFQVVSYNKNILKPYTILWHGSTNTWWVVSHDKVMRYANESGYMYVHELDCLGAIELLNARDLTDSGFRSNTYTIASFLTRLFSLSNFEYSVSYELGNLDSTQIVDYIKTFENYTLLSALREFLNGYNCGAKLSFRVSSNQIIGATLKVVSKTGDTDLDTLNIDSFHDIRETRTIDKNSYGTSVVTNAQNVVATKSVVFPSVGTAKLSSENRIVIDDNGNINEGACIRLPTPAYKVNKLTLCARNIRIILKQSGGSSVDAIIRSNAYDTYQVKNAIYTLISSATSTFGDQGFGQYIALHMQEILKGIKDTTSFVFYDGFLYDAMNDTNSSTTTSNPFKLPENAPSDMKLLYFYNPAQLRYRYIVLTDKATRDSFALPYMGIYWERGSNLIKGFEYFGLDNSTPKSIEVAYSIKGTNVCLTFTLNGQEYTLYTDEVGGTQTIGSATYSLYYDYLGWLVDYVPMTDLKVITDNNNKANDIQLYNQSGKLTDSVALSKLVNSYSKEITKENIVRYCDYYDFSDLPSVGQLVNDNGTLYVINNLSLDFYQNDQDNGVEYKIECEISMSKAIAVKSLMVNANSNIRDYGIPQKDNVARKQVYRDIFYLGHDSEYAGKYNYMPLSSILSFDFVPNNENRNLMAFIRCQDTYPIYSTNSDQVQSTTNYTYYQLPTTRFVLKKQVLYKLDFQDNNIIGYDSQNIASGWSTANMLLSKSQNINTPISYVNEVGKVQGINIQFNTIENTGNIYQDFADNNSLSGVTYIAQRVYVNDEIYQLAQNYASFEILENGYNKDALEIPVFEVAFQLIDSDDVLIGNNIFDTYEEYSENYRLLYGFTYADNVVTENNALLLASNSISSGVSIVTIRNSCSFSYSNNNQKLNISFYNYSMFIGSDNITNYTKLTPTKGKDIIIVRYVYDNVNHVVVKKDLLFVIKNTNNMTINSVNNIVLNINHKE